jgi:hypothetical protein
MFTESHIMIFMAFTLFLGIVLVLCAFLEEDDYTPDN